MMGNRDGGGVDFGHDHGLKAERLRALRETLGVERRTFGEVIVSVCKTSQGVGRKRISFQSGLPGRYPRRNRSSLNLTVQSAPLVASTFNFALINI